jgi:hypothetical protein
MNHPIRTSLIAITTGIILTLIAYLINMDNHDNFGYTSWIFILITLSSLFLYRNGYEKKYRKTNSLSRTAFIEKEKLSPRVETTYLFLITIATMVLIYIILYWVFDFFPLF